MSDIKCAITWSRDFLATYEESPSLPSVTDTLTAELPTPLSHRPSARELATCPVANYEARTPINVEKFETALARHPNRALVQWAVNCLRFGARLGFCGERVARSHRNHGSASRHAQPLRADIESGLASGRLMPLNKEAGPVWFSPLGVIPKKRTDKFRTITDFSFPPSDNINDRVVCSSTHYDRIPDLLPWLRAFGRGAFVAGADIADAFRIVPVHAADLWLQALHFEGQAYIDTSLVFGCKSSPAIFNAIAGLLAWIVHTRHRVPCVLHYLDDFILAAADELTANRYYLLFKLEFSRLGVPLKASKCYKPCQLAVHLGFCLDISNGRASLTDDKIIDELATLDRVAANPENSTEITHLIGWLLHACAIAPKLRPCVTVLQHVADHGRSYDPMAKQDFDAAVAFVRAVLSSRPYVDIYRAVTWRADENTVLLFSDATPSRGGYWCPALNVFASFELPIFDWIHMSEAFALYTAFFHLAPLLRNRTVAAFVDNQVLWHSFRHGSSRDPNLNRCVFAIFRLLFQYSVDVYIFWIPSRRNIEADLLSRNEIACLLARHPTAVVTTPRLPHLQ